VIDLSNNNPAGSDFGEAYASGQRRLYVKISEGVDFVDQTAAQLKTSAAGAGFKVGGYHFARPDRDSHPIDEADFFLRCLHDVFGSLYHGKHLRPCLDLEVGHADAKMGQWATTFQRHVRSVLGIIPVIYSYSSFLQSCQFSAAEWPLWVASYGVNNGGEYGYVTPAPWKTVAAHQFTSKAVVPGIPGLVDKSRVYQFGKIDVPLFAR